MSWNEFIMTTPPRSIALDGVVRGGPRYDPTTHHVNFDHHDCVVREATMCTAAQVHLAIKGGLMLAFKDNGDSSGHIFINDTDQDTSFAVWLLVNYKQFEGIQSHALINRLLHLTNMWDITGGAYPINLNDSLLRQHNWIFKPYADLRKSGGLAKADEHAMRDNLDAVIARLDKAFMGEAQEEKMDTRALILHDCPEYKIVDEIGGNEARYHLFSQGMNAFISIVARRPDGRMVVSVGRRSRYIPFPVEALYDDFNHAESLTRETGWNGSDIIGGSSRQLGTCLSWQQLRDITDRRLGLNKN